MKKIILLCLSALIGVFVGFAITFFAWTKFTQYALNMRLLGDGNQDLAMLQTLESKNFDLGLTLSKDRFKSSLVGLSASYPSLDPNEKKKADRLFEKAKRLGIEVPTGTP